MGVDSVDAGWFGCAIGCVCDVAQAITSAPKPSTIKVVIDVAFSRLILGMAVITTPAVSVSRTRQVPKILSQIDKILE